MACRIPSGGVSTFGSLIVQSFGYDNFKAILFNIPFGAIQIVAILGGGWLATKFQRKGLVIVLFAGLSVIGVVLMLTVPRENKGVLLFGYYLVSRFIPRIRCPCLTPDIGLLFGDYNSSYIRMGSPEYCW